MIDQEVLMEVQLHYWSADDYVISINGKLLGGSLNKKDADLIQRWFSYVKAAALQEALDND